MLCGELKELLGDGGLLKEMCHWGQAVRVYVSLSLLPVCGYNMISQLPASGI